MLGKLFSNIGQGPAVPAATEPAASAAPAEPPPTVNMLQVLIDTLRHELHAHSLFSAQAMIDGLIARAQAQDSRRLEPHGFKAYSQNEEDGLLQEIFRRIGAPHRTFVEFGCGHGMENNSAYLLSQGWRGLWMDGGEGNAASVRNAYAHLISHGLLQFNQTFITRENIDGLIAAAKLGAGPNAEIDMLSVDLDGNDYYVWDAIKCIDPRVVVTEYNAKQRPPNDWCMPYNANHAWNDTDYFGASLTALTRLGEARGYRLVGSNLTGSNAFFVRRDLCGDLFAEPATPENLYHAPRPYLTRFFHPGAPSSSLTIVESAALRAGLPWPPEGPLQMATLPSWLGPSR
jgi:hypothetical protein